LSQQQRRQRSQIALAHGVEGTRYGFRQLLHAGVLLSDARVLEGVGTTEPNLVYPWITNALIESFLANARRIGWFLNDALAGDAYAGDYLRPEPWEGWPAAKPIVKLVSDVLSHSKYVPKPAPYQWGTLATPLVEGMTRFIDRLAERESPWHSEFAPLAEVATGLYPHIRDLD